MSKKAKKKIAAEQRDIWAFSPVTKKIDSKKLYNRKRISRARNDDSTRDSLFCFWDYEPLSMGSDSLCDLKNCIALIRSFVNNIENTSNVRLEEAAKVLQFDGGLRIILPGCRQPGFHPDDDLQYNWTLPRGFYNVCHFLGDEPDTGLCSHTIWYRRATFLLQPGYQCGHT